MIELGALLGAVATTHVLFNDMARCRDDNSLAAVILLGPAVGAVWGAAVAAIIHYTADGTIPGLFLTAASWLLGFVTR